MTFWKGSEFWAGRAWEASRTKNKITSYQTIDKRSVFASDASRKELREMPKGSQSQMRPADKNANAFNFGQVATSKIKDRKRLKIANEATEARWE